MGTESLWHWIIVIGVVLLLFGRGKVSELMGEVAQGVKAFKKSMAEDETSRAESSKTEPVTDNHAPPESAAISPPERRNPG